MLENILKTAVFAGWRKRCTGQRLAHLYFRLRGKYLPAIVVIEENAPHEIALIKPCLRRWKTSQTRDSDWSGFVAAWTRGRSK